MVKYGLKIVHQTIAEILLQPSARLQKPIEMKKTYVLYLCNFRLLPKPLKDGVDVNV